MEMGNIPKQYDLSYKTFFSHPIMVESLLMDFVEEAFVRELDFSTLQRLPGDYVSEEGMRERHDDIVWRINVQDSSSCYVTVILEFQSSPDPLMPLRIQSYSTLLLLDIAKREHKHRRDLPPVFAMVLYNGKRPWNVALDAVPLFNYMAVSLKQYCPWQQYFLLDEGHMPKEKLNKANGLAAQLVKMEQAHTYEQFEQIKDRLKELLQGPGFASLSRMFAIWMQFALRRAGIIQEISNFYTLQEVNMLFDNATKWKNVYIQEGREKGEEIGERRGEKRGEAIGRGTMLQLLLEDRFGTLPEVVTAYIKSSDPDTLTSFAVFAHKAPSMQAITDRINGAQAPA